MKNNKLIKTTPYTIFFILALYPLLGMGIDLITPSLPDISRSLHTSASFSKNLVSIYFLGMGLGGFFGGLLSDFFGRRRLVLIGLFVFFMVSLLPTFIDQASLLLLARLLQGCAAGTFGVAARASVPNLFPPEKIRKIAAWIATLWGLGPIVGPVIGAYLQVLFGWQSGFYFFAIYGLILLIALYKTLPETLGHSSKPSATILKNNFKMMLTHRTFMGTIIFMGLVYSLDIVFNTLGPFFIETTLGLPPTTFGHLAMLMGVSFLLGTIACQFLIARFSAEKIFQCLIILLVLLISSTLLLDRHHSLTVLTLLSMAVLFIDGILYPTGMGKSILFFREFAGTAGAFMTTLITFITGLSGFAMSFVATPTATPIYIIYLVLSLLGWACYQFLIRNTDVPQSHGV